MDAELEIRRQSVARDGECDHGEIVLEFLLELREVADVVHALVEAAGEFRRDGLCADFFIGDGGENDEQFGRSLRRVGLVHRDFGDEVRLALFRSDVAVDFPRVLHSEEILRDDALDVRARGREGRRDARNGNGADKFRMANHECRHVIRRRGFADRVGDIEGEKIGAGEEAIHRLEADVIRVHVPAIIPAERGDRGLSRIEHALRLGADERVLTVRLVPDRRDLHAVRGEFLKCGEL